MAIARSWVRRNRRRALRGFYALRWRICTECERRTWGKTRPEVRRTLGLRQCLLDALGRERGVPQARPGEFGNRVADGRRPQWASHLPGPGRRVVGRYHLDVHQ